MEKLTVGKLKQILATVPDNQIVYLGDDEELNGIHLAFFAQEMSERDMKEFSQDQFKGTGFLIN